MIIDSEGSALAIASTLTGIPENELRATLWPQCGAYCVSQGIRGGITLLVGRDLSVLFAGSWEDSATIEQEFNDGRRTDPSLLEDVRRHNLEIRGLTDNPPTQ